MVPVDVVNLSLSEIGQRILISSFSDNSPAAQCANLNYTPRMKALSRAASWDFCRAQTSLTVWKAAVINGVVSSNPPPQPFLFSYLRPPDCIRVRFLLPTIPVQPPGTPLTTAPNMLAYTAPAPTGIPFVIGTDFDANGNSINVILTNLCNAQCIYTRDLTQVPDLWDPLYLNAATAYLSTYFINALARNKAQHDDAVATTKSLLDQARVINGDESVSSVDRQADWISARQTTGINWGWNQTAIGGYGYGSYDALGFSGGLRY